MSIKLFIFFFSAECRFLAFFLFLIWQHCHYAMDSTLVYLFLFLHIFNIKAAILLFLLCANGDLYRAYLIYWHFRLHSNTTYYNLWIFCVIIKNFKKSNIAHIVGNNNARMLLLASWHCCYRFGASISWLVAVFFIFRCNHMFVNLFIPIFGVYSITCSQLSGVAHIIFWYQVCDI